MLVKLSISGWTLSLFQTLRGIIEAMSAKIMQNFPTFGAVVWCTRMMRALDSEYWLCELIMESCRKVVLSAQGLRCHWNSLPFLFTGFVKSLHHS